MREDGASLQPVCDRYGIEDRSLGPVERIVLTNDGTVMRTLEALIGERVNVDILDRAVEGDVLERSIVLQPPDGERPLAWAVSSVDLSGFDADHARRLREGTIGIGELVRNERMETFRDITEIDAETDADALPGFVDAGGLPVMRRTYDIYRDGATAITITEYFRRDIGRFSSF